MNANTYIFHQGSRIGRFFFEWFRGEKEICEMMCGSTTYVVDIGLGLPRVFK